MEAPGHSLPPVLAALLLCVCACVAEALPRAGWRLLQQTPATTWREGTPLGNGRLGATVLGRASDERILLNHESLYNWSVRDTPPDLSKALPRVRALLAEGLFAEADRVYPDLIKSSGCKNRKGKFFPAFDIRMRTRNLEAFSRYSRELDMENGVCSVRWSDAGGDWERVSFVSCLSGAFVMRVRRTGKTFSASFALDRHDMADYPDYTGWDDFSSSIEDGATLFSRCKTSANLDYCGVLCVLSTDGSSRADPEPAPATAPPRGNPCPQIRVDGATEIVVAVDVSGSPRDPRDFAADLRRRLSRPGGFDGLLSGHRAAFSERFRSAYVDIVPDEKGDSPVPVERSLLDAYSGDVPEALVAAASSFGRYMLLSSAGFGCSLPPNLQGLWNGDYSPGWGSAFFLNENIQMAYWQALEGGLQETMPPLFRLLDSLKPDFRENARRCFGCRGILPPLFLDDRNGLKDNAQAHVAYWTASGAWMASLYFDYWRYTLDETFLRERAYPFMSEAAEFLEDFFAKGEDGFLHSAPAVSPENSPLGSFKGAGRTSVSVDPTMDIALARELFSNLLSAAETLGVDAALAPRRRAFLEALPPYATGADGALREWLHPQLLDNNRHRHLSHLYPLFPGREISARATPELFSAARQAALARRETGLAAQTGWSLAHLACVWARLGEGDRALECLELMLRTCTGSNLFAHHNDWRGMGVTLEGLHGGRPLFQADANFGFTAAVQEMVMQADGGELRLLPALPSAWRRGGRARGLRAPGGISVDVEWSRNRLKAEISNNSGIRRELSVSVCGDEQESIALDPSATRTVRCVLQEGGWRDFHNLPEGTVP